MVSKKDKSDAISNAYAQFLILELHAANQSLALNNDYDWTHVILAVFKESKYVYVTKTLQWTAKELVSRCVRNQDYNPDEEMMRTVTSQLQCNLPWSKFQNIAYDNCSQPEEFLKYFNVLEHMNEKLRTFPKKCNFDSWTSMPLVEGDVQSNQTSIYLRLVQRGGKVMVYRMFQFEIVILLILGNY